jgi:hypothetical protein
MGKALLAGALALAGITQAQAFDRALSGLWYNPAQSGHGFEVTAIDGDTASVAWYTYDKNGAPIWVSALLDETAPGVLSGNAQYIDGIKFGEFTGEHRQVRPWGTLKLSFTDCETASVEYNGTLTLPNGGTFGSGTLPLKKLAGVSGLACAGTKAAVAGQYQAIQRTANPVRQRGGFTLLEADGSLTMALPGYGVFAGTYTVTPAGAVNYTMSVYTMAPVKLPNNATTASYTGALTGRPGDYLTGTYASSPESGTLTQSWLGASLRTHTLATIAGTYNDPLGGTGYTAVINANGTITGTRPNNCSYNGTLAAAADGKSFNANVTLTNCGGENGAYTGKVLVIDYTDFGDSRGVLLALKNASNGIAVTLRRQ